MSVAQLEKELTSFNGSELAALEVALRREKGRRKPNVLSSEETRLYEIINRPAPHAERFAVLTQKWEEEGLAEEERGELMGLVSQRESLNVERVEAVQRLSELRGVPFRTLWKQMMGEPPALLVPRN